MTYDFWWTRSVLASIFIIKMYSLIHTIILVIIIMILMKASYICLYINFPLSSHVCYNFKDYLLLDRHFFLLIWEVQMRCSMCKSTRTQKPEVFKTQNFFPNRNIIKGSIFFRKLDLPSNSVLLITEIIVMISFYSKITHFP